MGVLINRRINENHVTSCNEIELKLLPIKILTNYFTSSGRKTYVSTVSEYLNSLEKAFILYKAKRYKLIASRGTEKGYYQVCLSIADDDVRKRELPSLQMIRDNYPKFLLTMDYHLKEEIGGIKLLNIRDFLLED